MSDHYDQREALFEAMKDKHQAAYDVQALKGAAEFFENMATMGNPAPLAFQQAIQRALENRANMLAALHEAERFMAYFSGEDPTFVGSGMPADCLAQIRDAISKATGAHPNE